jgi:2-methylcitrate dehydratase PrpD
MTSHVPGCGLADRIAGFALDTRPEDLPGPVQTMTKLVILDTLACAIAAHGTQIAESLTRWQERRGRGSDARLVVSGARMPATNVAYLHAQMANIFDADETFRHFAHFASAIVMPALAVGEMTGASGAELVAAVAIGFDVAARIGMSIPEYFLSSEGEVVRHSGTTFSWAALGSAVACGRLLGLDRPRLLDAIGIAHVSTPTNGAMYAFASNLGRGGAPSHKYGMYGAIGEAGLSGALLAREGFPAARNLLDRDSEFWRAFGAQSFDWDTFENGLGDEWSITGTSLKPYPFCRYGASILDMFDDIIRTHNLTLEDIDEVRVSTVPFGLCASLVEFDQPLNPIEIGFSVPFGLALIGAGLPPGPAWWDERHLTDARFQAFAKKVQPDVRREWNDLLVDQVRTTGRLLHLPTAIRVEAGTQVFEASRDYQRGDPSPENRLSLEDLAAKVHRFADDHLAHAQVAALVESAHALENISNINDFVTLAIRP